MNEKKDGIDKDVEQIETPIYVPNEMIINVIKPKEYVPIQS